jgi:general secretion pathway protein G
MSNKQYTTKRLQRAGAAASDRRSYLFNYLGAQRAPLQADSAFTFVELMVSITIILLLTTVALPVARVQIQRTREVELHRALRQLRESIDRYKDFSDRGMIPIKPDTYGYPPDLQTLVEGVTLKGTATAKYKFLRRLPADPVTGSSDWGMRSMQDDLDSRSWGGQNVFDVYCKSDAVALDGTKYSDW